MQASSDRDDWSIPRSGIDEHAFDAGRVGSFRPGPSLRRTAFGEVVLALPDTEGPLVELDLLDALVGSSLVAPQGELMADLGLAAQLRHRHLIPIQGAGLDEGMPYVVRLHRLGRTLATVLDDASLPVEAAAALLHAVADALDFLREQGPAPGSCSMGGFDARDVFLCFDGTIGLVGTGLQRARGRPDDPSGADVAACFALAREIDRATTARLPSIIAGAGSVRDIARSVRRRFPSACAEAAQHVGQTLRKTFASEIAEERSRFGLPALQ